VCVDAEIVATWAQFLSLCMISLPVMYWFYCFINQKKFRRQKDIVGNGRYEEFCKTTVFLPLRNEYENVKRKLEQVISEIKTHSNVELLIIESMSSDGTRELCAKIMEDSEIAKDRWEILSLEKIGKTVAVNEAIEKVREGLVIMMDADTESSGWLTEIWSSMEDEKIAVLSGLEVESGSDNARKAYKKNSDIIRMSESENGSTPVLEGGLICWRAKALSGFRLDESCNADDAQLAIEGIRRGYRSVTVSGIRFRDTRGGEYDFRRSARRSQGLSRVLLKNFDILKKNIKFRDKITYMNALFTYIVVPWSVFIFCFVSPYFLINFDLRNFSMQDSWNLFFYSMVFLSPQGRALGWGTIVSLFSHTVFLFGKSYSIWDPGK